MRTLAGWCHRHRILVVAVWLLAAAAASAAERVSGSAYSDNFKLPHTESFAAVQLLQRYAPRASGDTEQVVVAVRQGTVSAPPVRARMDSLLAQIAHRPHVAGVVSPYAPAGAGQVARSGRIAFATVAFGTQANRITPAQAKQFVQMVTAASGGGVQFEAEGQIARAGESQSANGSVGFGFLAAGLVLFAVFGSLAAVALPLLTAGISLATAIPAIGLLSHVLNMASFSNQLALLIGTGVGVDYALFVLSRYRQGLLQGLDGRQATVQALDTSGRAVLFAGTIVCIAMLGMFALGVSFLYGVAVAAAVSVGFTVIAALTLLPALLSVFGVAVLRRRERDALRAGRASADGESSAWARWSRVLGRHPGAFAAGATALMLVIAIPFTQMRLGSADSGSDPAGSTTRRAYDLLAQGFGPGYNGPLELVAQIDSRAQFTAFARVQQAVRHTPGVAGGTPPAVVGGRQGEPAVALAQVYPAGSPQAASTTALLQRVRQQVIPAATHGTGLTVLVGGNTAIFADFSHVLAGKLPLFIGIVVLVSCLLLMAVFRSVAIPLTAAAMNLLSTAAALGVVTAVFQLGWGASLLGDRTGPIEAFLPALMFPILFGLSMDYEVFLISRIYEEWHSSRDNAAAVARGLAATGRTITAAASIMVLVFGAFVLGGVRVIELFGIGLASAVLLDALLVRSLIVPAVMLLLGEWNWKLPTWLDRTLPRLRVESPEAAPEAAPDAGAVPEPA